MKDFKNRPFVLLGVNAFDKLDVVKSFVKDQNVSWRHFFDGEKAPIAAAWGINSYPTMFLIDHEGRIARANVHKGELSTALEKLVSAAEAAGEKKAGSVQR